MTSTFTRRDFVKAGAATSGLVLALQIPAYARTAVEAMARRSATLSPSALLQVAPDGAVTLWLTKSEMGQGIHSTLAMIVAEELEVPLDAVRMQQAGADSKYGYQFTAGSSGISDLWGPLRLACAQAREMLLGAAARTWDLSSAAIRRRRWCVTLRPRASCRSQHWWPRPRRSRCRLSHPSRPRKRIACSAGMRTG